MTEADWLALEDPYTMLDSVLSASTQTRKLRLFAAACCRRIWSLLPDDMCRQAVDTAEAVAEGSDRVAPAALFRFGSERASKVAGRRPDRRKATELAVRAASAASAP